MIGVAILDAAGSALILLGAALTLLAAIGLLRLNTPTARLHAAGKASPVGFLVAAVGAALRLGGSAAVVLLLAVAAIALTFPIAMHLLFRAVHRSARS